MWAYENPVRISFGAGSIRKIDESVRGRAYCLITYNEPIFHDIAHGIAATIGPAALTIDNVTPNPDFQILRRCCALFAASERVPEVIVALGGGSVMDAAKVVAAGGNGFAQDCPDGQGQLFRTPALDGPSLSFRRETRPKKRLASVDIAHAHDDSPIHQEALDRRSATASELAQRST